MPCHEGIRFPKERNRIVALFLQAPRHMPFARQLPNSLSLLWHWHWSHSPLPAAQCQAVRPRYRGCRALEPPSPYTTIVAPTVESSVTLGAYQPLSVCFKPTQRCRRHHGSIELSLPTVDLARLAGLHRRAAQAHRPADQPDGAWRHRRRGLRRGDFVHAGLRLFGQAD